MHNAPWVQYPVGRFSWALWSGAFLAGAAALGTCTLAFLHLIRPALAVLALALLCLGAALWMRTRKQASGFAWLVWDGQGWQWWQDAQGHQATALFAVSVHLDLQQVMLLQLNGDAAADSSPFSKRVWLYQGFAPRQWHGLRCAVYSRLYL